MDDHVEEIYQTLKEIFTDPSVPSKTRAMAARDAAELVHVSPGSRSRTNRLDSRNRLSELLKGAGDKTRANAGESPGEAAETA